APDGLDHGGRVLDGAISDGIGREGRDPQRGERVGPARLLDMDGLHTARPDVEAEDFRRLAEERHIKSLSPYWLRSIGRAAPGGLVFSHLLHSGGYGPPAPRPCNASGRVRGPPEGSVRRPRRATPPEFREPAPAVAFCAPPQRT